MSYAKGIYVLNVWAKAGESDPALVRANFKNQYGENLISLMGEATAGINFGVLEKEFRDRIDSGASKLSPSSSDIQSGLLAASAYRESAALVALKSAWQSASAVSNRAVGVASNVVDAAETGITTTLKLLPVLIVGAVVVYALVSTGQMKNVFKRS